VPRDMKNDWWFKFQYSKWDDPELRLCSLEAQGFWLRVYITLRKQGQSSMTATVEDFARIVGGTVKEVKRSIAELQEHHAADVTLCNAQNVTSNSRVTLTSRSLVKELSSKEKTKLRVRKHRENTDVTPVKPDRVRSKSKEKEDREEDKREETVAEAAPAAPAKSKRGSRLPDQFFLTADLRAWARDRRPDVDVTLETEKFCNHFRSAPGQKGVKLDWTLTWKNWVLGANGNGANRQHQSTEGRATTTDRLRATAEIIDQYPSEAELIN
jgi:hypothetical protein